MEFVGELVCKPRAELRPQVTSRKAGRLPVGGSHLRAGQMDFDTYTKVSPAVDTASASKELDSSLVASSREIPPSPAMLSSAAVD